MSESKLEKFKYGLLKAIDVSGFKVFDPVVRLIFGEEPKKQAVEVASFLVTPVIFIFACMFLWNMIAPRHKTNSGEVPTPSQVLQAAAINQTLNTRENEKEWDFALSGQQRTDEIARITALMETRSKESQALKDKLKQVKSDALVKQAKALAPFEKQLQELKAANKSAQAERKQTAAALSEKIASGEAEMEELLSTLRLSNQKQDAESEAEKLLKDKLKSLREKPRAIKLAELESNAAANDVQHLSKRLDYLQTGNRSVKVAKAAVATMAAREKLKAAKTPTAILTAAKSVVSGEEKAQKISEQTYPRRATIWLQIKRSLFTVFVGFVLAAVIAIPVGIMCGLNKVVMACLTPIISIFKPVSPVVWLLIFQIVVGAFFLPDPESFWLFELCDNLPLIGSLGVNPALVFSACTVAMCAVWPALVNPALGVSSIDQDHLNVARVLKLGLWPRLFKIVIPSSLPLVFAGLRISLGVGWMVLIAAEALSSSEGLGKFVWDEYQNGSSHSFSNIIFACFVVGIIGFFLDRMMIVLQRSVSFDDGAAVV